MYQRKVLGNPVDFAGRAVITPDVNLDIDEVGLPVDMMREMFKPFVIRRMVRNGMPAAQALKEFKEHSPRAVEALLHEADERPVMINRAPTLHKLNMTGHYAKPVAGHAMHVSNLILKGHAGDYDGDALGIHVPVSDAAVADVKDRMLPSKMLFHPGTFDVHMLPPQGYQSGLYLGSRSSDKRVRTFANPAAVARAYRSGEIDVDDPVVVLKPH
jgi:DNA-directed RNA polymerase subunit beta'